MSRPFANESVFHAISHPTRRKILDLLCKSDLSVGAMRDEMRLSWPLFSQHLRVLRASGLVKQRRQGRSRVYAIEPQQLRLAWSWLAR